MAHWRPMLAGDVPLVSAIAAQVHCDFFEDDAVFAERHALAPQGCWICEDPEGPAGYVLSHPWTLAAPPALNVLLGALPDVPDTLYVHDLALLPRMRGTGAGQRIVRTLIDAARAYPTMSLIAVNGSIPFWSRFGFAIADRPDLARKLAGYDREARFMVRASA